MSNLDQIRTRLMTLNASIRKLQESILTQQPLPSWNTLQAHANLISNNLQAISEQLAQHQEEFTPIHAFPLPQYPGRQHGFILETLLRTKLEPSVEEWRDQGLKSQANEPNRMKLSEADRHELWQWAPSAANAEARKQKWGADYTLAEKLDGVENVITGLQRELVEPPDDADDDDDDDEEEYDDVSDEAGDEDKMDIERLKPSGGGGLAGPTQELSSTPQMSLEMLHRFMTTGKVA